ncbi:flavodoxin family protein [Azospirillum doebereinerae]|uniref:NADPH-dependent oxidoreductase n=1 Tax=Azospirillum doebereinerae TaxID=92933 RepID=A0A3S0XL72_9PROT|nr:NAD(P)H-dependent oxidoreductase [Azospirillum doebereinerae]MCG5239356.1 NAD(P)H-dependent oxidoreductase [Azospirillum doebereinerae]RUQ67852.1 NADPH-dependent oxidoreductase [Azospirillum doebereinerae]
MTELRALALNCSLKTSDTPSSTDRLLGEILAALSGFGVTGEIVRVAGLDIKPGVTSDEGPGDAWPELRRRVLAADILLVGTPIWLGQPSSVCKRVLERMDAFFDETDGQGRMPSFGKVAAVAVVGNEDGAHHVHAELYQALNDVGFTLAAGAGTYWVGEAMQGKDYRDLPETPKMVAVTTATLARNAAHLARLLKSAPYPGAPEE